MKDINLIYNQTNPSIHFIVSAGQSINITNPGVYNIVPLDLNKIIAGFNTTTTSSSNQVNNYIDNTKSLLDNSVLKTEEVDETEEIDNLMQDNTLFTKNLSNLLYNSKIH